ncbi:MAG: metalloregulator ArsR/SmtB family transcription factor [Gemmatimonadota bacterium]
MSTTPLTPEQLEQVAGRFRVLADPSRLSVLNCLLSGERSVSELVELTGLRQANVSKHLQILHKAGFVRRRKEGLWVRYRVADAGVETLCMVMCARLPEGATGTRGRARSAP